MCSNAQWNPNALTFASQSVVGETPRAIFVSPENVIYFADYRNNRIILWPYGNSSTQVISSGNTSIFSPIFVTVDREVYLANGSDTGRLDRWTNNGTGGAFTVSCNGSVRGLFIDLNDNLYCSLFDQHRVTLVSCNKNNTVPITIAGTGVDGSSSSQLKLPWGIFVDTNFDLYVADHGNHRIQRFRPGQSNGITVAGLGIPFNLTLNSPTDVILDENGYLYIADNENHRIVRVESADYRCIAGCNGGFGSGSSQLYKPYSLRFDNLGNIYVADEFNHRIQKFLFLVDSCRKYDLNPRAQHIVKK